MTISKVFQFSCNHISKRISGELNSFNHVCCWVPQPTLFVLYCRADGILPTHPIYIWQIAKTFLTYHEKYGLRISNTTLHIIFHNESIYPALLIGCHLFSIMRNLCCYPEHSCFNLGQKLLLECYLTSSVIYTVVCNFPGQKVDNKPIRSSSLEK